MYFWATEGCGSSHWLVVRVQANRNKEMKIYNVVIDDRHADTDVVPFVDKSEAILYAHQCAKFGSDHNNDYWEEVNSGVCPFWVQYSTEGCYVKVLPKELITAEAPRKVQGKIVQSLMYENLVSIRDKDGHGIRDDLTEAGFVAGDKVVILPLEDCCAY